jgi:Outer membrane protein beta-barrel domain
MLRPQPIEVRFHNMTNTTTRFVAFSVAILSCVATPAWAQRTPHRDMGALGGDVGVFLPKQDGMTTGPSLEGFFEHYLTSRDSIRADVGWSNPKVDRETSDSTRQIRVGADLIHNWEGGAIHPFVGAGLGAYFLQAKDNGNNVGDSQTRLGGDILGGVEFFTSNRFSIKGEGRYHIVSKANGYNPSGLALTIGIKSYF